MGPSWAALHSSRFFPVVSKKILNTRILSGGLETNLEHRDSFQWSRSVAANEIKIPRALFDL